MAINYPTSADTLTNPTNTSKLNSPSHADQHANANDAIEALEAKVGTGASTATANTVLRGTGAGTTAFGQVVPADVSNPYRARAYRGTAQSVNQTTATKVQFASESYDGNNNFDSATNYRYTAPVSGYYMVTVNITMGLANTDRLIGYIYKNNAVHSTGATTANTGSNVNISVNVTDIVYLAATDYVEGFVYHTSSGAQNIVADGTGTYIAVHLLSAA